MTRFFWATVLLFIGLFVGCSSSTTSSPDTAETTKTSEEGGMSSASSVTIELADPTEKEPVSWGAALDRNSLAAGDTALLVIRAKILDGWHIYAAEGETGVGTQTKLNLTLPDGIEMGEWSLPIAKVKESTLGDRISHHKKLATFSIPVTVSSDATAQEASIVCDVDFQSCTDRGCLAPTSKQLTIPVSVTN